MNDSTLKGLLILFAVLAFFAIFILCIIWHHVSSIRYQKLKDEKGKQYKWFQLFGQLNEIGFWIKFIASVLFALTIFISLHYLCTTYPHELRKEIPDFDYMSVICAFFGVLVTLLVGWQIYKIIMFEKNARQEAQRIAHQEATKATQEMAFVMLAQIGNAFFNRLDFPNESNHLEVPTDLPNTTSCSNSQSRFTKECTLDLQSSLSILMNAALMWSYSFNSELALDAFRHVKDRLHIICEQLKDIQVELSNGDWDIYIKAALKLNDDNIIKFVKGIKVV